MNGPGLSLVVICHDMPEQMVNTLFSLSPAYQRGIQPEDYEVVIVENASHRTLPARVIDSLPGNFRYFLREEASPSPAGAVNFGLSQAGSGFVGVMIDGAHLLSPGVLHFAARARAMSDRCLVTVPAYHLGPAEQHESAAAGYDEAREASLLQNCAWQEDGYRLFTVSSNCGANPRGYLAPVMESNCFFAPRSAFQETGGADISFQQPGGGAINLHMLRLLGLLPAMDYFCLGGEGSFHQFHGGVTSNISRRDSQSRFESELQTHWHGDYRYLERNPILLGSFRPQALDALHASSRSMQRRFANCRTEGWQVWADDKHREEG